MTTYHGMGYHWGMDTLQDTLQERLKSARRASGVTLRALGDQGISRAAISRWERGLRVPTLASIERLARIYGVDLGWLAWGIRRR